MRSENFTPFGPEEVETYEIGLKSELWDNRARVNLATFTFHYEGFQIDFTNPSNVTVLETINAEKTVEISGFELDLSVIPMAGLLINASYVYLDGDMPLQPNPLAGGELQKFGLTQTPRHASALFASYQFGTWSFGTLAGHLGVTSTTAHRFTPTGRYHADAYTLFNANISLADIKLGRQDSTLALRAWGKNLTDEEYVIYSQEIKAGDFPFTIQEAFGTPRTLGVDVTIEF